MSIHASATVWSDAPYEGGILLVLLALADFADGDGLCWPSVQTLAKKARLGVRHVYNILSRLRADGVISIETPGGDRGQLRMLADLATPERRWKK
jgi:hypothetical protein